MFVWYLVEMRTNATEAAYSRVRNIAESVAAELENIVRDNEAVLRHLASRPLVRKLDRKHCDPILSLYIQARPASSTLAEASV